MEDLSYLTGDFRIFQRRDGHRWSLDDLITAWVALRAPDRPLTADAPVRAETEPVRGLDLGCGIGSVLMMLAWGLPAAKLVGVERQSISLALARRSIAFNGIDERVEVHELDLRELPGHAGLGSFDLVTGTPPYFDVDHASISSRPQRGPCRFVLHGGIEDYVRAAASVLPIGASAVFCDSRLNQEIARRSFSSHGLEVIDELTVFPREGKPPRLHVWRCVVTGTHLHTSPRIRDVQLTVRDRSGGWTEQFRSIRRAMGMPDRGPNSE